MRQSAYSAYEKVGSKPVENAVTENSSQNSVKTVNPSQVEKSSTSPKKASRGLFLRVSSASGQDCTRAGKMCSIFEGNIPVILYYQDSKQYNFSTGIVTADNPDLITGLKRLLGENNVVLKL